MSTIFQILRRSCGLLAVRFLYHAFLWQSFLWPGLAVADYQPFALNKIIDGSDLIALGTISEARKCSILLEKFDIVVGPPTNGPLEIPKFKNWSGSSRWVEYRVGQTLLLFLVQPPNEDGRRGLSWRIRGLGGEGELPVEGDYVFSHGPVLQGFDLREYVVAGEAMTAYRFDLDSFVSAIKGYRQCFVRTKADKSVASESLVQICDDEALAAFGDESAIADYLVRISLQEVRSQKAGQNCSDCRSPHDQRRRRNR